MNDKVRVWVGKCGHLEVFYGNPTWDAVEHEFTCSSCQGFGQPAYPQVAIRLAWNKEAS